jgi:hypothetical protein
MSAENAQKSALKYLGGYSDQLRDQVCRLVDAGKLGDLILNRYPQIHGIRSNRDLYAFTLMLKNEHLRKSQPLSKVVYDDKIHAVQHALGQHAYISRVQGSKLKAKNEIRVASVFRRAPLAFLRMILVHELVHLKEKAHNRAFYQLCSHIEPDYHQLELDMRLYLTHLELVGPIY